jgi:hypothetical protein
VKLLVGIRKARILHAPFDLIEVHLHIWIQGYFKEPLRRASPNIEHSWSTFDRMHETEHVQNQ